MNLFSSERSRMRRCSPGFLFGTVKRSDCHLSGFLAFSMTLFFRNSFMKRFSSLERFWRSLFRVGGGIFQDQLRPILTIPSWAAPRQCFRKGKSLAPTGILFESFLVFSKITTFAMGVSFRFIFIVTVYFCIEIAVIVDCGCWDC